MAIADAPDCHKTPLGLAPREPEKISHIDGPFSPSLFCTRPFSGCGSINLSRLESLRLRVTTQEQILTQEGPELVDGCLNCLILQGTIFSYITQWPRGCPVGFSPMELFCSFTTFYWLSSPPFPPSLSPLPQCASWDPLPNNLLTPKFLSEGI